jgi:type III secretory pathway component EscS
MELSSPRFKSLAVTLGLSLWFFIISSALGVFSIETFGIFIAIVIIVTQIFSVKLSRGLDLFAIVNTKIFLGILFVCVFSLYGVIFKFLRIDLLRLKKNENTYWLDMEQLKEERIFKQY